MLFAALYRISSARPTLLHISRLTATATFAYLLALVIPAGTSRPVLAPLTALLVLQASLYQTIRSAIRKVLSVTVGVLVAIGVAEFIGFSWWQLALVIGAALVIGRVLRLGDDLLEVPISAMLIFSSAGTHAAATGRVVDTLVGAAAGLAGGLVFAGRPRVQPARSAVGRLSGQVAGLLDRMASDLAGTGLEDAERGNADQGTTGQEATAQESADRAARPRSGSPRPGRCAMRSSESTTRCARPRKAPGSTRARSSGRRARRRSPRRPWRCAADLRRSSTRP